MEEIPELHSSGAHPLPEPEFPLSAEEMDCLDESLALRLCLDDVDDIASKQKGKAKEGHLTDPELSLLLWGEELLAAKRSSEDRRMAQSMSNAIASDQDTIDTLGTSEMTAESDRAMAISLSGAAPPPLSVDRKEREVDPRDMAKDSLFNAVSEATSSLMVGLDLTSSDASSQCGEMSRSGAHPPPFSQCVSCFEAVPVSQTFKSRCHHIYCRACMKQLFLNATKDEELYPPRCCGNVIDVSVALHLLSPSELVAFNEKGIEWTTVDRIYCADPTCSAFIPPWRVTGEAAKCPTCRKTTHTLCKSLEHLDKDCPSDEQLQQILEIGELEGWRRCFNCRAMIELGQGCNHMTCRCGKEFCYVCGLEWKTCQCVLWDENRLRGIANRVVEQEIHPDANDAERGEAWEEAVFALLNHEDVGCRHERRSQWRYVRSPQQCEFCFHHLPMFIFECTLCRMRACKKCMRNRLR